MTRITNNLSLLAVLMTLLIAGCGNTEEDNHGNEEVTPAGDACEHMIEGPAESVTAVEVGGDPSSVSTSHTRYEIAVPGDPAEGEFVFEIAEAGDAFFYFGTEVDLTVTDSAGTQLSAEETLMSVDECSEVAYGEVYDVGVGAYTLTLRGSETVDMVYVPGSVEGHSDEEHSE